MSNSNKTNGASDKQEGYFPIASQTHDGWSNQDEATATCYCGAVQLVFPLKKPGLVNTFVCHCSDCHKITATTFATNFSARRDHIRFVRGNDLLQTLAQSKTITSGNTMTNHFCSKCGTLMARDSSHYPHLWILRLGTVDDFTLANGPLRPRREIFTKHRVPWLAPVKDAKQYYEMWD